MKVKTDELISEALDYIVAKCECHEWRCPWMLEQEGLVSWRSYERAWGNDHPNYSTDQAKGGLIIDRTYISTSYEGKGIWLAGRFNGVSYTMGYESSTRLIAAMRCYVASIKGDEVEIPKEIFHAN